MITLMNRRRTKVFVILTLAFVAPCLAQRTKPAAKDSCMDTATTQKDLNLCAGSISHAADVELNRVYAALLEKLKNDPVALESLKESERQWVKYRDAEENALHPHVENEGTVHPMCVTLELAELTQERIKRLRRMLEPDEGDVCGYSPNQP